MTSNTSLTVFSYHFILFIFLLHHFYTQHNSNNDKLRNIQCHRLWLPGKPFHSVIFWISHSFDSFRIFLFFFIFMHQRCFTLFGKVVFFLYKQRKHHILRKEKKDFGPLAQFIYNIYVFIWFDSHSHWIIGQKSCLFSSSFCNVLHETHRNLCYSIVYITMR